MQLIIYTCKVVMLKLITVLLVILYSLQLSSQHVYINEVLAGPYPNPADNSFSNTANANSLYSIHNDMLPPFNREFIELYNANPCDTIDISCYTIGSNANSYISGPNWGAFTFPQGTKIPPLGFIIIGGNDSQVPYLDFNITDYRQTSFNSQYLTGDSIRWFLRDAYGWVALYDPQGSVVDAVYWNHHMGSAASLYIEDEYQSPIITSMACGGTQVLAAASSIPGINYVGHIIPGSYTSFQRVQDGSPNWHPTPVTPTPRAPNGAPIQPPTLSYQITPANCGNNDGEIVLTILPGGTAPYTIYWNGSAAPGGVAQANLPAGTHTVEVRDYFDCLIVHDTLVVPENEGPEILFASIIDESCSDANGEITVQATGGVAPYSVVWNTLPPANTFSISGLNAGTYAVTVTDTYGCTTSDSVTISNHPEPTVSVLVLSPDSCGKNNGKAVANVIGNYHPYDFYWDCTPPQFDSIATDLPGGWYSVTVTDGLCTVINNVNIPMIPGPVVDFEPYPQSVYIEDGMVTFTDLSFPNIVQRIWNFDDGNTSYQENPVHQFTSIGTYNVKLTATDINNCSDSIVKPVNVKDLTSAFFPNAFNPNGDGLNDVFKPYGTNITNYKLIIFDRAGREIFITKDPEIGWDGTQNGVLLQEGVYVWLAAFSYDYGNNLYRDLKLKGTVTLIR